jgi:amidase
VPFLLKDSVLDVAGVATSYGSRSMQRVVPTQHAAVTQRLLDAGLVIFGKTNLPEFGLKGVSDSQAFGRVANPWDPSRTPGGSSGGSAAAVAAGVVPMASGNDGGGSLRIPASYCGLFALKPSRGRISNGPGIGEVWFGACTEGVISRSVRDSALALDLEAGPVPGDPYGAAAPPAPFAVLAQRPPRRLRIAFSTASPIGTPVHGDAVAAVRHTAALLERLGHQVEEAAPAIDGDALARAFLFLYFGQIPATVAYARAHGAQPADFELLTRVMAVLGQTVPAGTLTIELVQWNTFARALGAFHQRHDVWLTPTTAGPALQHGATDPPAAQQRALKFLLATGLLGLLGRSGALASTIDQIAHDNLAHVPFTQIANLTGVPAMSVPLHWTADGLPVGVQFVAPLGDEATLLQLATQLEAAQPWFDRLAPMANES